MRDALLNVLCTIESLAWNNHFDKPTIMVSIAVTYQNVGAVDSACCSDLLQKDEIKMGNSRRLWVTTLRCTPSAVLSASVALGSVFISLHFHVWFQIRLTYFFVTV